MCAQHLQWRAEPMLMVLHASQISAGEENGLRIRVYGTKAGLSWCQENPNYLDVLPADQLLPHCKAVAGKLVKNGPLALSQAKRVIEIGADQDLRAANELECQAFGVLFGSEDQKEGMKAFLEKRPAAFAGR